MENKECVKKDYKNECGMCPVCKSYDLHYHNTPTIDGEELWYSYHCNNCGLDGEEMYYVEFTGHRFYDDEIEEEIDLRD